MIKINNKWMLILNLIIAISSFLVVIYGIVFGAVGNQFGMEMDDLNYFMAFTNLSNIFNAIVCFMVLTFNLNNQIENKADMPKWLSIVNYISSVSTTLTFITVVFFLAPMQVLKGNPYFIHFKNDLFFFHFLNPVLTLVNVLFLNKSQVFNKIHNLYACIPVILYICLYTYMVLSSRWSDFYA